MAKNEKKVKSKRRSLSRITGLQIGAVNTRANTLTVYELGNCDRGIFPTAEELSAFRKMVEKINSGKKNAIFAPEGLVKITQFHL